MPSSSKYNHSGSDSVDYTKEKKKVCGVHRLILNDMYTTFLFYLRKTKGCLIAKDTLKAV